MSLTKEVREIIERDLERCNRALKTAMIRLAEITDQQQKLGADIHILEEYRTQLKEILEHDNDLNGAK